MTEIILKYFSNEETFILQSKWLKQMLKMTTMQAGYILPNSAPPTTVYTGCTKIDSY